MKMVIFSPQRKAWLRLFEQNSLTAKAASKNSKGKFRCYLKYVTSSLQTTGKRRHSRKTKTPRGNITVHKLSLLLAVTLLAGCASSDRLVDAPIIDRKGVDMAKYAADKAECEQYAAEVNRREKVARGAIGGAVVGGAIGAIINRRPNAAERGAGVGAVTGGIGGAREGNREVEQVIKQCLRGRGYKVLN